MDSVRLVDGGGVDLAGAWVAPSQRAQGGLVVADWADRRHEGAGWRHRTPVSGARLRAGQGFELLLHIVTLPGATVGRYSNVEVTYDVEGTSHTALVGTSAYFNTACPQR